MSRVHLFEIEDQAWCPQFIREGTTDYLLGLYNLFNLYEPAYQKIKETLDITHEQSIIDCCSGSGGPTKHLREYLDKTEKNSVVITLTDKFPNKKVFESLEASYPDKIIGCQQSLDASQLPSSFKGMRTFFSAFHHFSPEQAVKILQDAVNNNAPIGVFECTQRHPADFIRVLFSPILTLFVVPKAKRLNWKKFIMTYIIPVTPFANMWDYFVSNLRTYSPKEIQALIEKLDAPDYQWEIGKLWSEKAKCQIPYFIGYKVSKNTEVKHEVK